MIFLQECKCRSVFVLRAWTFLKSGYTNLLRNMFEKINFGFAACILRTVHQRALDRPLGGVEIESLVFKLTRAFSGLEPP